MISTKSSRTNVGSKCLSTSALITVVTLEVSITFWRDVLASSCSIGHLDRANPPLPVGADSGPNIGVRVDAHGLNWSRGVGARCGARASAVVRSAGQQRRFVWLGVLGVTSWAAVLWSIKPVVAPMNVITRDQDHRGDLWPGFWTSVFFGVTPAAGPGVVVAVISRTADHCVTGFRRQDEPFGRLNPEHLVGMLG